MGSINCSDCPQGTFRSDIGSKHCSPCPPGTSGLELGASQCPACPAGTFSPGNTFECAGCPAGTFSTQNSSACSFCPLGKFSDQVNRTSSSDCSPCEAGTSSASDFQSCVNCRAGEYSSAQTEFVCTPCPAGKVSLFPGTQSAQGCVPCNASTYADAGSSTCTACPYGKFSARGAGSCGACFGVANAEFISPGLTCNWRCRDNHFLWKRDASFMECLLCPQGSSSTAGQQQDCVCADGLVFRRYLAVDPSYLVATLSPQDVECVNASATAPTDCCKNNVSQCWTPFGEEAYLPQC